MTEAEFTQWIEEHYGELLAVAKRRDRIEPEDVLQAALATVLSSRLYEKTAKPWTWCVQAIRAQATSHRRSASRRKVLRNEVKKVGRAGASLGWKQQKPRSE